RDESIVGRSLEKRQEYVETLFSGVLEPLILEKGYGLVAIVDHPRGPHAIAWYARDGKIYEADSGSSRLIDLKRVAERWFWNHNGRTFLSAYVVNPSAGLEYLAPNESGDRMLNTKGMPDVAPDLDFNTRDLSLDKLKEVASNYNWTSLTSRTGDRVKAKNRAGIVLSIRAMILMGEQICLVDTRGSEPEPLTLVGNNFETNTAIYRDSTGALHRPSSIDDLFDILGDGCFVGVPVNSDYPDRDEFFAELLKQKEKSIDRN
ncbi:MAG: hypothetical protein AAF585_24480, partial [Verrucomicrobiota bacterium]